MVIFRYEKRVTSYEEHKSGFASRFSLLVTRHSARRTLKTTAALHHCPIYPKPRSLPGHLHMGKGLIQPLGVG